MQRTWTQITPGALIALVIIALAACSDAEQRIPVEPTTGPAASLQTALAAPHHELVRLVALSLKDPIARSDLLRAIRSSPVKEGKLELVTHLRTPGNSLLAGMVRAVGGSDARIFDLLRTLGAQELYFPVSAHRAAWNGDDLLVASQLEEDEVPFGVDLDGRPVPLSLAAPPSKPTLVIVPAESFDEDGRPLVRDTARAEGGSRAGVAGITWTGVWVNEVHVGDLHEPWPKGSPEFEMHLDNAGTDPRSTIVCTDEDLSVEPYRWDMDDEDYSNPFLLAEEREIPVGAPLVIHMWEDDATRCVLKVYDAEDYVKLVTDYLKSVSDVYKGVLKRRFVNDRWVMKVLNAYITARTLIEGGDDFVGVAAGLQRFDETPRQFVLKDQNGVNQGVLVLQWRSLTID
jgi:hypothetical protein